MKKEMNGQDPKFINGLSAAAEQYSGLLIDAWGVIHDGACLYPGVAKCLSELRARSIPVVVISNAARRAQTVLDEIIKLGVPANTIDAVISSGEVFWQSVKNTKVGFQLSGQSVFYYGPDHSRGVLTDLGITLCEQISDADIILNTGCIGKVDTIDQDLPYLQEAVKKEIPMICINPDLVAIRHGIKGFSAGKVAEAYQALGASDVRWIGKPHKAIYDGALALLPEQARVRVLAVGDALRTDISGANNANIDSLFISSGIHNDELEVSCDEKMQQFFEEADMRPTYYCKGLMW